MLTANQIQTIQNYFLDEPILKAELFGSYAKNTNTDNSDIDILVDLDYNQIIDLEFIQYQLDLEKLLDKKVDLISSRAISKYILPLIEHDKIVIYEQAK